MSRYTSSLALLKDTALLALDTLRANKLRSGLTILGIVIGITSIVGMTSLIRGFDQSMQNSMKELGPNTIFVAKISGLSLTSGASFVELARRPNITVDDMQAIQKLAPSVGLIDRPPESNVTPLPTRASGCWPAGPPL